MRQGRDGVEQGRMCRRIRGRRRTGEGLQENRYRDEGDQVRWWRRTGDEVEENRGGATREQVWIKRTGGWMRTGEGVEESRGG